jgi:hypothetical protein
MRLRVDGAGTWGGHGRATGPVGASRAGAQGQAKAPHLVGSQEDGALREPANTGSPRLLAQFELALLSGGIQLVHEQHAFGFRSARKFGQDRFASMYGSPGLCQVVRLRRGG